jgi:hypothetical protein
MLNPAPAARSEKSITVNAEDTSCFWAGAAASVFSLLKLSCSGAFAFDVHDESNKPAPKANPAILFVTHFSAEGL